MDSILHCFLRKGRNIDLFVSMMLVELDRRSLLRDMLDFGLLAVVGLCSHDSTSIEVDLNRKEKKRKSSWP